MKCKEVSRWLPGPCVAPVRERGLKYCLCYCEWCIHPGRSREGAWIEIELHLDDIRPYLGRSREGAWIEINAPPGCVNHTGGRSREGAWIEIADSYSVAEAVKASLP